MRQADDPYEVRRYLPGDREALLDLLAAIWGRDFRDLMARLWEWKYERNPLNPPGGHNSMVLTHQGRPVGFLGMLSANVQVGRTVVPIAWGSELAVHPAHRGQGYRVIRNIGADAEKMIAGTARTRDLAGLPLGFGAFDITRMISHKIVLQPDRFLAARFRSRALGRLGAGPLAATIYLARAFRRGPRAADVDVAEIAHFGPQFDELWDRVRAGYELIAVRDSRFLNWRFRECPTRAYTVLAARRGDLLVGYIVVRIEEGGALRRGFVVDLLAERRDRAVFNRLLAEAEAHFRARGVATATCTVSRNPEFTDLLKRNGYLFASPRAWITGHCGCREAHAHLRQHFEHSTRLLMTRADTDLDYNY